jgi:hypothetical protein
MICRCPEGCRDCEWICQGTSCPGTCKKQEDDVTDEDDIATTTEDRPTRDELIAELETLHEIFCGYVLHHLRRGDLEEARANSVHVTRISDLIAKARSIP